MGCLLSLPHEAPTCWNKVALGPSGSRSTRDRFAEVKLHQVVCNAVSDSTDLETLEVLGISATSGLSRSNSQGHPVSSRFRMYGNRSIADEVNSCTLAWGMTSSFVPCNYRRLK